MAILKVENFTGIAPRLDPKKLPDGGAQQAERCLFQAGDLRPLRQSVTAYWPGTAPSISRKIHAWKDRWLAWNSDNVDVVNTPVVGDTWERIYWSRGTGGAPRFAVNNTMQSAVDMSLQGEPLGVAGPTTAPTIVASANAEPQADAQTLSKTSPVRAAFATPGHPFEDGQRVIVTLAKRSGAGEGVPDTPPDRTGMVEIVGKTYTTRLIRDSTTGIADKLQVDLIGADGIGFSDYNPSNWIATIKRVYTDQDNESRSYVFTRVSTYGEESQPSPASAVVDVLKGAAVSVRCNLAGAGFKIRLYRSVTGTGGTTYHFVKETGILPPGNHLIEDDVAPERIGEVLPSETWAAPPANLAGMVSMPGGFLVGFVGNTLYFSEPYMPHAWPLQYTRTTQEEIVALGVYGQTLVVATRGKPYLASGTDPSSVSLRQLDDHAPCMSRKCLTSTGTGVIYPTGDGLVHVSSSGVRRLTQGYFTKQQWESEYAGMLAAIWYDGKYIATISTAPSKVAIFEPHDGGIHVSHANIGLPATAYAIAPRIMSGNTSIPQDTLFFAQGAQIMAFDRGSPMSAEWVGKVVTLPRPVSFACAQVLASGYPVTLKIHAGLVQAISATEHQPRSLVLPGASEILTIQVLGPEPFRLPAGFSAREWRIDITTSHPVQGVYLATSMDEIKQI